MDYINNAASPVQVLRLYLQSNVVVNRFNPSVYLVESFEISKYIDEIRLGAPVRRPSDQQRGAGRFFKGRGYFVIWRMLEIVTSRVLIKPMSVIVSEFSKGCVTPAPSVGQMA